MCSRKSKPCAPDSAKSLELLTQVCFKIEMDFVHRYVTDLNGEKEYAKMIDTTLTPSRRQSTSNVALHVSLRLLVNLSKVVSSSLLLHIFQFYGYCWLHLGFMHISIFVPIESRSSGNAVIFGSILQHQRHIQI